MNDDGLFMIIIQVAQFAFIGCFIGGIILFRYRIPILNRPKYKVIIKELLPDGRKRTIQQTDGWEIKSKGIEYFWVQTKGALSFWRGIKFDRDYLKTIDEHKEVSLICSIPESKEPTDYYPENVPLTQKERFIEDERKNMESLLLNTLNDINGLLMKETDEKGNEHVVVNPAKVKEKIEMAELKTKQNLHKHSRIVDLDSSKWLEDKSDQQAAQKNRASGDNLIEKLFPYLALILIGFFAFLAYDSISKNWIASAEKYEQVTNLHTQMIVQACGGHFVGTNVTQTTQQNSGGGLAIPFISK